VRQLREAHPDTPILLVEDRSFTNAPFFPTRVERHRTSREALKGAHRSLLDSGYEDLYYLDGEDLLGSDAEASTDGSHPNDLGMMRYADAYEPALRRVLGQY
jgi:lysophospholipase L1-like esterase